MASITVDIVNKDTKELKKTLQDYLRPELKDMIIALSPRETREFAIAQISGSIKANSRILPEKLTKRFDEVQLNLTKLDNEMLSTIYKSINQVVERFQKEIAPLKAAKLERGATIDIDREIAKKETNSRDTTIYLIGPLLNTEEYLKPKEWIIGSW
jgi:hypothetical protein